MECSGQLPMQFDSICLSMGGVHVLHPAVSVAGRWGTPLDQFKFAVPWRQNMKIIAMVEFPKHMMVELVYERNIPTFDSQFFESKQRTAVSSSKLSKSSAKFLGHTFTSLHRCTTLRPTWPNVAQTGSSDYPIIWPSKGLVRSQSCPLVSSSSWEAKNAFSSVRNTIHAMFGYG